MFQISNLLLAADFSAEVTNNSAVGMIGSFIVKLRIELDGIEINNNKPLLKSIFGYQVSINLIRKTIVRYEREIPKIISEIWRTFISKEITII